MDNFVYTRFGGDRHSTIYQIECHLQGMELVYPPDFAIENQGFGFLP